MFSARDIHEENAQNELILERVYNKELQSCLYDIRTANNKMGKNKLTYLIPCDNPLEPEYNFVNCVIYLIDHLRDLGFNVRFKRPNFLFISWIHPELEYKRKENIKRLISEENKSRMLLGLPPRTEFKLLKFKPD